MGFKNIRENCEFFRLKESCLYFYLTLTSLIQTLVGVQQLCYDMAICRGIAIDSVKSREPTRNTLMLLSTFLTECFLNRTQITIKCSYWHSTANNGRFWRTIILLLYGNMTGHCRWFSYM